jgi:hypothetical protein
MRFESGPRRSRPAGLLPFLDRHASWPAEAGPVTTVGAPPSAFSVTSETFEDLVLVSPIDLQMAREQIGRARPVAGTA